MLDSLYNEFAVIMSLSVIIGLIAIKLRQPLILSFIIVGFVAGPSVLGWITAQSEIEVLANFGVTLLLFIVGLKLDLQLIKSFGPLVILIGLGQIVLTAVGGLLIGFLMGMAIVPALFVAAAVTFSSTIIIVKVLSDRDEIDSLYGRITVGILIVQDLVVVIALIILSSLRVRHGLSLPLEIASLLLRGIGFLAVIALLMRYVLPALLPQFARSRELLVLFGISWAVILAVSGIMLGFSQEIGGFLAGVSLASTRYRESLASRLETLRNLLLLFFFLNLGASLHLEVMTSLLLPAVVFSVFVLLIKPLIIMTIMIPMRFRTRTSFLAGFTLGQLSEFSLILAMLGVNLGFIGSEIEGLITFIAMVTIGISTYVIAYATTLYQRLSPWLARFERDIKYREDEAGDHVEDHVDIIVFGFGRHGKHLASLLAGRGFKIMGIDFDPRKLKEYHADLRCIVRYGDAEDAEFPKTLPLTHAKWVVSTVPHHDANQLLVSALREVGYRGKIALSAYHENEIEAFNALHVDLVLIPFRDAAYAAAEKIVEG